VTAAWILLLSARMSRSLRLACLAIAALGATVSAGGDPALTLQGGSARLQVVTPSGWGEVLVDGAPVGVSPVDMHLPAGRHRIDVLPTTYHQAASREVELVPGQQLQVAMWPPLRPSWFVPIGFPQGTVLLIDGGPGPMLEDGMRVIIDDALSHAFTFRLGDRTLRRVLVKRCVEVGCLLPGSEQVEQWTDDGP